MRQLIGVWLILGATSVVAQESQRPPFPDWLQGVREEALAAGIAPSTIALAFDGLEPLEVVVERDRTQAETVLTVDQYLRRRLSPRFVRAAREQSAKHRAMLKRVGDTYGVQPRFLVAIWGLESNFGRFSGVRPVVQALATLAWEGRRGPFFKAELINALQIVDRGDIALDAMKGSWAGAMGQTQFMPSSYLKHAEDFDGDGHRDIWASTPDVLASIANYLKSYGWQGDETWGRQVRLPSGKAESIAVTVGLRERGCRAEREMTVPIPIAKWRAMGVSNADGKALPSVARDASLVRVGSSAYLVYGNYDSLLGYNCAHAYALAVSHLADRIGR